jgi:hypothetical protein
VGGKRATMTWETVGEGEMEDNLSMEGETAGRCGSIFRTAGHVTGRSPGRARRAERLGLSTLGPREENDYHTANARVTPVSSAPAATPTTA